MGLSIWQEIEVTTTVVVRGSTGGRERETTWTVHAEAKNETQTVAGMERATNEALAKARRQAQDFAATFGAQLQASGAHPSNDRDREVPWQEKEGS